LRIQKAQLGIIVNLPNSVTKIIQIQTSTQSHGESLKLNVAKVTDFIANVQYPTTK
jgi:hypothetical protein